MRSNLVQYVRDLGWTETLVAESSVSIVGFLGLRRHNACAAEIHVIAVLAGYHGRGVGRALVARAESILRERAVEYLQVKTLGPSRPDAHYERTRGFYEHLGFRPLEENNLWGAVNPCLMVIVKLRDGSNIELYVARERDVLPVLKAIERGMFWAEFPAHPQQVQRGLAR